MGNVLQGVLMWEVYFLGGREGLEWVAVIIYFEQSLSLVAGSVLAYLATFGTKTSGYV